VSTQEEIDFMFAQEEIYFILRQERDRDILNLLDKREVDS